MSSTLVNEIPDSKRSRLGLRVAPAVAVSATADSTLGGGHRVRLNSAYIIALESAGLVPVVVPPLSRPEAARSIVSRVEGIVLTGGEDVDPALYGQARHEKGGEPNRARDDTEIALVAAARDMHRPVLAICRGPQILNVALGGTLYQDISSDVPGSLVHDAADRRTSRVHDVEIEPGSRIGRAMSATRISVNSLHHQSARDVAPGLRVTARAPDGIIEGLESDTDEWWVIAVQWHPEEMNDSPESWDRGLFRAFADRLAEV